MTKLLFIGLAILMFGCTKNEPDSKKNDEPQDEPKDEITLKDKLIGKWLEISPCDSCSVITFSTNDTIYEKHWWAATIYASFFEAISADSIMIIRNWDIETNKIKTNHKVVFYTNDTALIELYTPLDVGVIGFGDILLKRIE